MNAVAVDLGGTYMRLGAIHGDSEISNVLLEVLPPYDDRDESSIWQTIIDSIVAYCDSIALDETAPIILAFPGPILNERYIASAPTIVGNADVDKTQFIDRLESLTRRRALLLNDVSAAAWFFSRYSPSDSGIVVTISSGIGAKIFNRNAACWVEDKNPFAGEIGHVMVDTTESAPLCDCGKYGHLSAISSGRAAERSARRRAKLDPIAFNDSLICTLFDATPDEIENETHLVPAVLAGDPWACEVVLAGIHQLAASLALIVTAQGLKSIIVMGGFAKALGSYYIEQLQQRINHLTDGMLSNSVIVTSATSFSHDTPALRGCGIYARMSNKL
jgi:predicted NBD/HSP70 family sugar kinase